MALNVGGMGATSSDRSFVGSSPDAATLKFRLSEDYCIEDRTTIGGKWKGPIAGRAGYLYRSRDYSSRQTGRDRTSR